MKNYKEAILDKLGLSKGKDKASAQETASAQEVQQQASSLTETQNKGAVSAGELITALDEFKAKLEGIKSLSAEDIATATGLLDDCRSLLQGKSAKVDVSELDQQLLRIFNVSLISFFVYKEPDKDIDIDIDLDDDFDDDKDADKDAGKSAWERALDMINASISRRTGDENEVYDAGLYLRIVALQAMNLSLYDSRDSESKNILRLKRRYKKFCEKKNITDIDNVKDPNDAWRLQVMSNSIMQAEMNQNDIMMHIAPNENAIYSLKRILDQRKRTIIFLPDEEFEQINDIVKSSNNSTLDIHALAVKRIEQMKQQFALDEATREELMREWTEKYPNIKEYQKELSNEILKTPLKEFDTVPEEQTELDEEMETE